MTRRASGVVRWGLAALAALNLGWGAWALVAPRPFFDTFPGLGHHWTAAYPPYNEHLVTDLGATFVTLGILLAIASVVAERRVRATVLVGVMAFDTLHFVFHTSHRGTLSTVDYLASLVALVSGILVPLALLVLICRTAHR